MSEAGIEKSAALLLALGEDASAAVFPYLSPLEVSRLGAAMRSLDVLPRERVRAVLRDYAREAAEQTGFAADTARFLDQAITRAWPPERAQLMLRRLGHAGTHALDALALREPADLAGMLESQPAALVAVVTAHLPRDLAAAMLDILPAAVRAAALAELARRETPAAESLSELEDWLARITPPPEPTAEGEAVAANLLGRMSQGAATAALAQLDHADAGLAARLRARALEFDDLLRTSEDGRRHFLRQIGARTLLLALKGSDGRVLAALSAVMSPTAALRMRDDLDTLGAVPVAEIQTAQQEAVAVLRRLAAEGALQFDEPLSA